MKALQWSLFLCLVFPMVGLKAQSLSFTAPQVLLPQVHSDQAVDITRFKQGFFLTWKNRGIVGTVGFAYLGQGYDTGIEHQPLFVPSSVTAFGPVWRWLGSRLYLLWITEAGGIDYLMSASDTAMDTTHIHHLGLPDGVRVSKGISAALAGTASDGPVPGSIVIAVHGASKEAILFGVTQPGSDGLLQPLTLSSIPGKGSMDYPFVASLPGGAVRFAWRGGRDNQVYSADYTPSTGKWSSPVALGSAAVTASGSAAASTGGAIQTGKAPAIFEVFGTQRMFYVWRSIGTDPGLHYATAAPESLPFEGSSLPSVYATDWPVAMCDAGAGKCILAFTGKDNHIYASAFFNYDPSKWMESILHSSTSTLTLKDIVIPGSHDAGMSVLSGVGGTQSGTINPCNTLTQAIPIKTQLQEGLRMFDLRVGNYNGVLYTKHASSDCMADAIGGGYGERLCDVLQAIHDFLDSHHGEVILLSFSHFCEQETPVRALADSITTTLGVAYVFRSSGRPIGKIPLKQLAGKVLVTFEHFEDASLGIDSCTIAARSGAFINFRREYAATDELDKLLGRQESFFRGLSGSNTDPAGTTQPAGSGRPASNDLVRLDWQLTQSPDEAAMICNDFQNENVNPLINGAMSLTNVLRKHKRIIDLAASGNKYLPQQLQTWINSGLINQHNKPNILYVDVAGRWITDYCVGLNLGNLYGSALHENNP